MHSNSKVLAKLRKSVTTSFGSQTSGRISGLLFLDDIGNSYSYGASHESVHIRHEDLRTISKDNSATSRSSKLSLIPTRILGN